ncbi:hypothetical protein AB0J55_00235 [Amycolatopsis sp. NPDC049688]|uniref:hypothetical protein n=1 Tax=Amycolatopsis sp. NPDC049688 TaxID=3154733 RepID=UPI0034236A9A
MPTATLLPQRANSTGSPVAPLAYGYMRVPDGLPDRKVYSLEQAVIRYAHDLGLHFVRFFFEFHCGARDGFEDLITELRRTDARHVVVPSLRHLALNTLLQDAMRERLALDTGAQVHAMRSRTAE